MNIIDPRTSEIQAWQLASGQPPPTTRNTGKQITSFFRIFFLFSTFHDIFVLTVSSLYLLLTDKERRYLSNVTCTHYYWPMSYTVGWYVVRVNDPEIIDVVNFFSQWCIFSWKIFLPGPSFEIIFFGINILCFCVAEFF